MPSVSPLTTPFLRVIILAMSIFTSPVVMPCRPALCRIDSYSSDESSSAFEGMQPMLRHVPPNALPGRRSTQATLLPNCAARIAAVYPPGPPPITTRSNFSAAAIVG